MIPTEEEMIELVRHVGLHIEYVPMVRIPVPAYENGYDILTHYRLADLHTVYERIRRGVLPI